MKIDATTLIILIGLVLLLLYVVLRKDKRQCGFESYQRSRLGDSTAGWGTWNVTWSPPVGGVAPDTYNVTITANGTPVVTNQSVPDTSYAFTTGWNWNTSYNISVTGVDSAGAGPAATYTLNTGEPQCPAASNFAYNVTQNPTNGLPTANFTWSLPSENCGDVMYSILDANNNVIYAAANPNESSFMWDIAHLVNNSYVNNWTWNQPTETLSLVGTANGVTFPPATLNFVIGAEYCPSPINANYVVDQNAATVTITFDAPYCDDPNITYSIYNTDPNWGGTIAQGIAPGQPSTFVWNQNGSRTVDGYPWQWNATIPIAIVTLSGNKQLSTTPLSINTGAPGLPNAPSAVTATYSL